MEKSAAEADMIVAELDDLVVAGKLDPESIAKLKQQIQQRSDRRWSRIAQQWHNTGLGIFLLAVGGVLSMGGAAFAYYEMSAAAFEFISRVIAISLGAAIAMLLLDGHPMHEGLSSELPRWYRLKGSAKLVGSLSLVGCVCAVLGSNASLQVSKEEADELKKSFAKLRESTDSLGSTIALVETKAKELNDSLLNVATHNDVSDVVTNRSLSLVAESLVTDGELRTMVSPLATSAAVTAAVSPLVKSYEITAALQPLAKADDVTNAVTPLAKSREVTAAVAPLATNVALLGAVAPLATATGVVSAVTPLATSKQLETTASSLAKTSDVKDAVRDLTAAISNACASPPPAAPISPQSPGGGNKVGQGSGEAKDAGPGKNASIGGASSGGGG